MSHANAQLTPRARLRLARLVCDKLGITHKRTRPYRPQTNGKIERFHRTLADGWAYMATALRADSITGGPFTDFEELVAGFYISRRQTRRGVGHR